MLSNCFGVFISMRTLLIFVIYISNVAALIFIQACRHTQSNWETIQCNHRLPLSTTEPCLMPCLWVPQLLLPHSAVQSPAIQMRSPVERRMKMTPCPSRPSPQPLATSLLLLHSRQKALQPAACLPALASGVWTKCHSLFHHYKVGRFFTVKLVFYFVPLFLFLSLCSSSSSSSGCEELASQFLSQEIDGQALLLLKEEHLMSTMNIKLGPALKICAHINTLRDWGCQCFHTCSKSSPGHLPLTPDPYPVHMWTWFQSSPSPAGECMRYSSFSQQSQGSLALSSCSSSICCWFVHSEAHF